MRPGRRRRRPARRGPRARPRSSPTRSSTSSAPASSTPATRTPGATSTSSAPASGSGRVADGDLAQPLERGGHPARARARTVAPPPRGRTPRHRERRPHGSSSSRYSELAVRGRGRARGGARRSGRAVVRSRPAPVLRHSEDDRLVRPGNRSGIDEPPRRRQPIKISVASY